MPPSAGGGAGRGVRVGTVSAPGVRVGFVWANVVWVGDVVPSCAIIIVAKMKKAIEIKKVFDECIEITGLCYCLNLKVCKRARCGDAKILMG